MLRHGEGPGQFGGISPVAWAEVAAPVAFALSDRTPIFRPEPLMPKVARASAARWVASPSVVTLPWPVPEVTARACSRAANCFLSRAARSSNPGRIAFFGNAVLMGAGFNPAPTLGRVVIISALRPIKVTSEEAAIPSIWAGGMIARIAR